MLRQLGVLGGLPRRVLLSLPPEELFESTMALVVCQQHGHHLKGALFGRQGDYTQNPL
jgi:hypothetical protein